MKTTLAVIGFVIASVGGVSAQESESVLLGDFAQCVKDNQGVQGMAGACLKDSLNACSTLPESQPAAIGCFISAKEEFQAKINARLVEISEEDSPRIHLIAGIEVKYDNKANLIPCERQRELNFLGGAQKIQLEYVNARCEAMAYAQTLVMLLGKSGWFNR